MNYYIAQNDVVEHKMIDGQQCLVIRVDGPVEVNGVNVHKTS